MTSKNRSWNMSRIKSGNTKPELVVRSLLHSMGYRFRLHRKDLPGKPDIVLPKYRSVIFVHGCFWHRHHKCKYAYNPKSNMDFWQKKFKANIERDVRVIKELKDLGWNILIVWECEIKDMEILKNKIYKFLENNNENL